MVSAGEHPPAPMKVLLWKIGALGDVLMTTPLVRQLRGHLPHAKIDYLVGRSSRAVLQGNPHLDRLLDFDERILLGPQVSRLGEVLSLLRGYDQIYILDKHWIFGWLARAAGVRHRVGFRRRAVEGWPHTTQVAYGTLRHEIDCYLDLADAAGSPTCREDVSLQAPLEAAFEAESGSVVLINSGGDNANERSTVRRMPDSLFGALVETCAARHAVAFVGSGSEAGYYAQFEGSRRSNLCGRTSLAQATAVLRRATRVITTDTGLMHLAAAVNGQVTAVFGPTHPLRKCPPGACWAWGDEARYDARYELFGSVPEHRYFGSLTVADIVERAHPSPFATRPVQPPE